MNLTYTYTITEGIIGYVLCVFTNKGIRFVVSTTTSGSNLYLTHKIRSAHVYSNPVLPHGVNQFDYSRYEWIKVFARTTQHERGIRRKSNPSNIPFNSTLRFTKLTKPHPELFIEKL